MTTLAAAETILKEQPMEHLTWHGCYDDNWQGLIVPDAFAHPAKFSRGLIDRIFRYMLETGMVRKGDVVVDPFGGIGTGGIIAANLGLQWFGCELEPKFAELAGRNFSMHLMTWQCCRDPVPVLVNGDSRKLRENLRGVLANAVVCSPPYSETPLQSGGDNIAAGRKRLKDSGEWSKDLTNGENKGYGSTPGQLGKMRAGSLILCSLCGALCLEERNSEPSTLPSSPNETITGKEALYHGEDSLGVGNDDSLKSGTDTSASSADQPEHSTSITSKQKKKLAENGITTSPISKHSAAHATPRKQELVDGKNAVLCAACAATHLSLGLETQASAPSNVDALAGGKRTSPASSAMKAGDVAAVVSSPPYSECLRGDNTAKETADESRSKRVTQGGSLGQSCRHAGYGSDENLGNLKAGNVDAVVTSPPFSERQPTANARPGESVELKRMPVDTYGTTEGQLGNTTGETFWHAARDIVSECYAILRPGGHSAWVVKDFVRAKARVPFCDDWCKLLEACGFTVTARAHAMLVKETSHPDLFGGEDHVERTERKSFFRRLAEKKGSPKIDFEEVIFARKQFP